MWLKLLKTHLPLKRVPWFYVTGGPYLSFAPSFVCDLLAQPCDYNGHVLFAVCQKPVVSNP